MYNIKNPERLNFIRKIKKEKGMEEIFSIDDAKKKNILLSKKLETDILLRFAGITQISQAISNVGSKKNQNFVIIAIGKKSDFNLLFNEINNNLTKKPLKDNSIFLKKYFRINQKQLESVDSLTPLEDLIVEKSSILV